MGRLGRLIFHSFIRFQAAIICVIGVAFYLIHVDNSSIIERDARIFMAFILGVPLFTAIQLFSERGNPNLKNQLILHGIGIGLLLLFIFEKPINEKENLLQYSLYLGLSHLLVSLRAFKKEHTALQFWDFNKKLFLGWWVSAVYTLTLIIGIGIALGAISSLFSTEFPGEFYSKTSLVLGSVFTTWVFLARVPVTSFREGIEIVFPKGLKFFTIYILLPLTGLYFGIISIYAITNIGKGLLKVESYGYLLNSFAIIGVLTFLLIYPLEKTIGWIKKTRRIYFFLLVPHILWMLYGILYHIHNYGFTANRYLVLIVGIWLLLIGILNALQNNWKIKFIPVSLIFVLSIAAFGPLSMRNVSERSQIEKLKGLFAKNGRFKNNQLIVSENQMLDADIKDIESSIHYLNTNYGINAFKGILGDSILKSTTVKTYEDVYNLIQRKTHIQEKQNKSEEETIDFSISNDKEKTLITKGYDYTYEYYYYNAGEGETWGTNFKFKDEGKIKEGEFAIDNKTNRVRIMFENANADFNLNPNFKEFEKYSNDSDIRQVQFENEKLKIKMILNSYTLTIKKGEIRIDRIQGHLMLKVKE